MIVQPIVFFTIQTRQAASRSSYNLENEVQTEDLSLVRVYENVGLVHASIFQVITQLRKSNGKDESLKIIPIKAIRRVVHVAPDFSTALNDIGEEGGVYEKYLVNHDINPTHWSFISSDKPFGP
ncbi:hypothetical protein BCR43DRAFT_126895 [Syncephalastrum racemosum]|uniref:Uncharacterized protein n=1 Tax=Syncephalastrum racemosum TaxID=13706 RepID=A0A1X2HKV3_SYNRA|nr:hypothetical protein BCR43DRAFT_126895 [Syncephalastrum racemosum]